MYFLSINRVRSNPEMEELADVISAHAQWLKERITEGSIVQAGKWGRIGGMAVIKAGDITEATGIISEDPLVKSGLVTLEIDEFLPNIEMK